MRFGFFLSAKANAHTSHVCSRLAGPQVNTLQNMDYVCGGQRIWYERHGSPQFPNKINPKTIHMLEYLLKD